MTNVRASKGLAAAVPLASPVSRVYDGVAMSGPHVVSLRNC